MTMDQEYFKLAEKLPLKAPLTLMIDPSNRCNFKCTFCPTGDTELLKSVQRPAGIMSYELFTKIIDDLKELEEPVGSIRLFKDGEPFVNRKIVDMVRYAKESGATKEVYIISNGSLIKKEFADGILDAGLDRLRISVEHVTSEKYKEVTQTYGRLETILDNIRYLYEQKKTRNHSIIIDAKIVDTGLTEEEKKKFYGDWGPISDSQKIETLMGWSMSDEKDWTLGTDPEKGIDSKAKIKNIEICPEPFKGLCGKF